MRKLLLQITLMITFVFTSNSQNWTEIVKLESLDQQSDDNQGISVAKSGDYIISGAWHEDHDGTGSNPLSNAGAAYIYHYNSTTDQWTQEAKLVAADREIGDWFGISVDISGSYAVIGAVEENAARGAAYVFERNTSGIWVQVVKLEAAVRQSSDRYGNSVSISGNTIIVGAFHEDEDENDMNTLQNAGSAYIYNRINGVWVLTEKIVASDRDSNDYFGYSVAIHEDKVIVGAYHRDIPSLSEYGGAYAFAYNSSLGEWEQTRIMEAIDPFFGDRFGWSVDVYENYYIVGTPYHDFDTSGGDAKNNAGAAYIFDSDNSWAQTKIVGGDRTAQDNAGLDVSIYGTRALLGAPLQNYGLNGEPPFWSDGGAIFLFEKDSGGFWNQEQKLLTGDRFTSDKFGHSVDLDDETIIGGAPEDNSTVGPSTGALYIFKDETLGANDVETSPTFSVYPNPTTGKLTVTLKDYSTEVTLTMYNNLGQRVLNKSYSMMKDLNIEITGPSGLYILNLTTSTGESSTFKLIKK